MGDVNFLGLHVALLRFNVSRTFVPVNYYIRLIMMPTVHLNFSVVATRGIPDKLVGPLPLY